MMPRQQNRRLVMALMMMTRVTSFFFYRNASLPSRRPQHQQTHHTPMTPGRRMHACNSKDSNDESFGLYVHIPYCRRRCNYCDFAIVPIGDATVSDSDSSRTNGFHRMDEQYKQAILNEIEWIGSKQSSSDSSSSSRKKIPLRSIYFGGGTPSLAPLSTLKDIMNALLHSENAPFQLMQIHDNFNDDDDDDSSAVEITIEMDPGTFNQQYLQSIKDLGFNRISLGVQSFDDAILETMGRVHRSKDIYNSVNMIAEVFGEDKVNYSIDLISGVPGLKMEGWKETLSKAVCIHPQPNHISVYDLQLEKGTTFAKWYANEMENDFDDDEEEDEARGRIKIPTISSLHHPKLPSAVDCASMYRCASEYLRASGFEHYEISSFSRIKDDEKGPRRSYRSKHNQIYWEIGGKWYAVGLGATSNVNGRRYSRPRALADYIAWSYSIESSDDNPPWVPKDVSEKLAAVHKDDALLDIIMTRLRTAEGLDQDWIAKEYGKSYVDAIFEGVKPFDDNLVTVSPHSIKLKDPDGFLFSNNIISNIFVELLYENERRQVG